MYDVDGDGLARWVADATGVEVSMPAYRGEAWFAEHTYRVPVETVRRIAGEVGDRVGFVCGTVGNDGEIWELFDAVVSLSVDAETLRQRLVGRGAFGSEAAELERVLAWHSRVDEDNEGYGAVLVDATGPVEQVADRVLAALERDGRCSGLGEVV
ncbi:hypothetical protein [Kribbella kalugense]|uniref:hypothetical protein n=1 Tax=Kribbella kalugense TaxID=2512221 RepID=UPI001065493F|nr:hypothetical protein [Kribbella kalugense]